MCGVPVSRRKSRAAVDVEPLKVGDYVTTVTQVTSDGKWTVLSGCVGPDVVDGRHRLAGTAILLLSEEEGRRWIRGYHVPHSDEARALLATVALVAETPNRPTGPTGATGWMGSAR